MRDPVHPGPGQDWFPSSSGLGGLAVGGKARVRYCRDVYFVIILRRHNVIAEIRKVSDVKIWQLGQLEEMF